ncbi:hypothetical protein L211DRAFT_546272 [Terfezia boudieri ATCC MYA-4762]|uniref:Uncharacterized protein n=1 Tax=Terfezia boudieri ATCC MYA-4762 TaxID=1051890 RepID=A0A3N4LX14_9PEZI|nr:hypothetical protein L211DRAFT_546272 [Terfezia boudieri ATCC MYA-4762]
MATLFLYHALPPRSSSTTLFHHALPLPRSSRSSSATLYLCHALPKHSVLQHNSQPSPTFDINCQSASARSSYRPHIHIPPTDFFSDCTVIH